MDVQTIPETELLRRELELARKEIVQLRRENTRLSRRYSASNTPKQAAVPGDASSVQVSLNSPGIQTNSTTDASTTTTTTGVVESAAATLNRSPSKSSTMHNNNNTASSSIPTPTTKSKHHPMMTLESLLECDHNADDQHRSSRHQPKDINTRSQTPRRVRSASKTSSSVEMSPNKRRVSIESKKQQPSRNSNNNSARDDDGYYKVPDSSLVIKIKELQKQLETMQKEKIDLEVALEQEQERMVNHIARQMDYQALINQPSPLRSPKWRPTHSPASSISGGAGGPGCDIGSLASLSAGLTETLKAEINTLRLRISESEVFIDQILSQTQLYRKELIQLRQKLGMSVNDLVRAESNVMVMPSGASSAASSFINFSMNSGGGGGYCSNVFDNVQRPRRSMSVSTPSRRPAISRSNSISRYSIHSNSSTNTLHSLNNSTTTSSANNINNNSGGGGGGGSSSTSQNFPGYINSNSNNNSSNTSTFPPTDSQQQHQHGVSAMPTGSPMPIKRTERPSRARSVLLTPRRSMDVDRASFLAGII
ncbi:hypothetical protein H4219_005079 [Mycoemilia scoparia]|uniref:Uncharacterized protein n=1 Tax=Mycoemilia scoparia TaxID=417184 RepID=A0A9W7ZW01_9FUNG|nr:hypothetical protein H4219_005079 [Mycoemilia scoparia]